jgi:hypothetical protein
MIFNAFVQMRHSELRIQSRYRIQKLLQMPNPEPYVIIRICNPAWHLEKIKNNKNQYLFTYFKDEQDHLLCFAKGMPAELEKCFAKGSFYFRFIH